MAKAISIDERFNLKGKTAVVIGGCGNLGSVLANAFDESGVKVAVVDLNLPKENNLLNPSIKSYQCNVTNKDDIMRVHQEILETFKRVDILLNAAGTNAPTPVLDITEEEFDKIMASHMKATLFACQVFGESMLKQKAGSIINFASASSGPPLSRAFVYSAAKAGVMNLTQNLGREWATSNVRVNAIRPGFFPTEWSMKNFIDKDRERAILGHTPMARYGKPEELIGAILWLASDAASFTTGSIVAVDGGFTAMTI